MFGFGRKKSLLARRNLLISLPLWLSLTVSLWNRIAEIISKTDILNQYKCFFTRMESKIIEEKY